MFFFFTKIEQKLKNVFFFKKYDFRSIFLQKFCFLCLIFVRFSQPFPQKIFLRGICLINRYGEYVQHIAQKGKWNLWYGKKIKFLLEMDKVIIFFFLFCKPCFGVQAKMHIKIIHFKRKNKINETKKTKWKYYHFFFIQKK